MNKQQLRKSMRERRQALSPATQNRHAQDFLFNMIGTHHYQRANSIACYMPIVGELDTRPLMHHALECGRELYLPVIDGSAMWFAQWSGEELPVDRTSRLAQPLKRSRRLQNVRTLDLVIVPLIAFATNGTRLGQGGGYYDRTFAYHIEQCWRRPALLGAAHHVQEAERIPVDPWDVPLSGIVTNNDIIYT